MKIEGIARATSDEKDPVSFRGMLEDSQKQINSHLVDRNITLDARVVREALSAAEQRGNRLFFCAVAWEWGHDLIDRQEHELAAQCFQRLSLFSRSVNDHFSAEAARVAERLCEALSLGEQVGAELLGVRMALRQDLAQLTNETLAAVATALAAHEGQDLHAYPVHSAPQEDGEENANTGGAPAPTVILSPSSRTAPVLGTNAVIRTDGGSQDIWRALFFGRFELYCCGRAVPLCSNRKGLSILKYLLARRGRPVSQDYLLGWLWPASDLKRARWSLNSAVHGLRKLLTVEGLPLSVSNHIRFEHGYYHLSPSFIGCSDVDEFEVHVRKGRHFEKTQRLPKAVAEYERAVELYRGDYLADELYEDWTMAERERLWCTYIHILHRLAAHCVGAGRLEDGVTYYHRILEKDHCHEETHRLLMRCYASLGLRDRALRQYRLCEQVLRRGYDAEPTAETQDLFRALMKGGTI